MHALTAPQCTRFCGSSAPDACECVCLCADDFLENHSVAITGGKIVEVLPTADAAAKYSAAETVDLPGHCIMPGLINMHTVSARRLLSVVAGLTGIIAPRPSVRVSLWLPLPLRPQRCAGDNSLQPRCSAALGDDCLERGG
jgi:cytosine/adenosine deaminase-related metal-dependent hydrolase